VHVTGPEALAQARALERRVDALILDTYDPMTGRHGATGQTHDWSISRQIVAQIRTPVILAGGLTPDNVAEAIRTVRPWAVDVHTGVEDADGTRNLGALPRLHRACEGGMIPIAYGLWLMAYGPASTSSDLPTISHMR